MDEITVDRSTLKALGADTRIAILKKLSQRKMTQSELAHSLGLSVAAVNEHLKNLENAGLVSRVESSHKWKYFQLTGKGASIVKPVGARVLLIVALVCLAFAVFAFNYYYQNYPYSQNAVVPSNFPAPAFLPQPMPESSSVQILTNSPTTGSDGTEAATPAPPSVESGSTLVFRVKPGDRLLVGGKVLRMVSVSPIAVGAGNEPPVYFELLQNGSRVDYFSMDKGSPVYDKNGVVLKVNDVFVGSGDTSYAIVTVHAD